jgi:hypothetical protein
MAKTKKKYVTGMSQKCQNTRCRRFKDQQQMPGSAKTTCVLFGRIGTGRELCRLPHGTPFLTLLSFT